MIRPPTDPANWILPKPEGSPLPPLLLQHFEIGAVLGTGGAATVYEAVHRASGAHVAVKVALDRQGQNHVARFRREARILNRLHHPNVVRLLGWGVHDSIGWMAMERADGTVYQRMRAHRRPLPLREVLHYTRQTVRALRVVHAADVIHRDVKPSNLLLVGSQVQLADFGIARTEGSSITSVGAQLGSRSYMAPEQFVAPATVDASADVYGLAASAYSMATRASPAAMNDLPIDHPRWWRVGNEALRALLHSCLLSERRRRPGLEELAERLAALEVDANSLE